jgi:hypothetical protein
VHLGAGDGTFGAGIALDSLAGGTINNSGRRRMLSARTADPQVTLGRRATLLHMEGRDCNRCDPHVSWMQVHLDRVAARLAGSKHDV